MDFPSASATARGIDAAAAAGVAHDARNVMAALRLYSELLAEPGVLTAEHRHYIAELDAIATAGCGLVDKLAALQPPSAISSKASRRRSIGPGESAGAAVGMTEDIAEAVQACAGLLTAIAGPQIQCVVDCLPCNGTARISPEDLTRVLINLVRNAQEAMPRGGRIRITVRQGGGGSFLTGTCGPPATHPSPRTVLICVQDSGPGIAADLAERIFDSGFSTKGHGQAGPTRNWPRAHHRGLGLHIVRALIQAAGGQARAASAPGKGARFEIELPLAGHFASARTTTAEAQTFVTGACQEGQIQC